MAKTPLQTTKSRGWETSNTYSLGDIVDKDGYPIKCLVAHTSGTYSTDVTSGKWQLVSPAKNNIINGNFDIWQRGTSFSSAAGSPYTADRWWFHGVSTNTTIAQVTTSLDLGMQYACSLKFTSASSSTHYFPTPLEGNTVRTLQGKTVTLSVRYKNILNASAPWGMAIQYSTTENQKDPGTALTFFSLTNSASWTTAQVTFVVPSAALSLQIRMQNESNTVNNAEIHFGKVMLNEGPAPAPFQTAGANIAEELMMCQRFYEKDSIGITSSKVNAGSTGAPFAINYKVPKRSSPTFALTSFVDSNRAGVGPVTWGTTVGSTYSSNNALIGEILVDSTNLGAYYSLWTYTADAEMV